MRHEKSSYAEKELHTKGETKIGGGVNKAEQ